MKKITLLAAMALAAIPTMSTAMPEKDAVPGSKSTAAGLMRVGATVTNAQIIADTLKAATQKAEANDVSAPKNRAKSNNLRIIEAAPAQAHYKHVGENKSVSSGSVAIKVSIKPQPAEAEDAIEDAVAAAVEGAAAPEADPTAANETWADIDETERYLLIMGNADGFSAAGPGAPCFPGKSNSDLNNELISNSFADKPTEELTDALASLSEDKALCAQAPMRGYTVDLIKTMSDEHIAIYLTGLVRGYSHSKACPVENHQYAAGTVTAAIFAADPDAQPVGVIADAMAKGCEGIGASAEHSS